jgi:hypothetical protein
VSVSTTTASPWPRIFALTAAAIFIAASGATNITYGWSKGDTLATSLVWAGVAGAVAIVLALSWPAMIRSLDQKRWGVALIAFVALVLSGAYSVTAALGSAAGGRANAAVAEMATSDARVKVQAAYDAAKADLEALAVAKPATELRSLLEVTKTELAKLPATRSVAELEPLDRRNPSRDCGAENGTGRWVCQRPGPFATELGRARQRERLEGRLASTLGEVAKADERLQAQRAAARQAMEKASVELAGLRPTRQANADAVVLARYLAALGLTVTADRLNDLLVLLSVLVIEAGGGLSLAIGMAFSGPPGCATEASADNRGPDGANDASGLASHAHGRRPYAGPGRTERRFRTPCLRASGECRTGVRCVRLVAHARRQSPGRDASAR